MDAYTKYLFLCFLLSGTFSAFTQVQYSDTLLDSYYSGSVSIFNDFYGVDGSGNLGLVDPAICVGNNPWFVSLPKGSYVTVGFTDNAIFDAPNQNDIFIQEKGNGAELGDIFISSDMGNTFTYFGTINGGTTNAIDLADINYMGLVNAIKIVGLDNNGSAPGFDLARIYGIEGANCEANAAVELPAICQDSFLILADFSEGIWIGDSLIEQPFSSSDTGQIILTHIVEDAFSPCPNDTAQVAIHVTACDCSGLPYGEKEIDVCGLCLDPQDTLFNQSCLDCSGIPFGTFTLDLCHQCLLPDDAHACTKENLFYFPNAFSPNGDNINDLFELHTRPGVVGEVIRYTIYDHWGSLIYMQKDFPLHSTGHWWDGYTQHKPAPTGVYIYHVTIQIEPDINLSFSGDLTLIK